MTRQISSKTLNLFDDIHKSLLEQEVVDVKQRSKDLQIHLDEVNKDLLSLLADPVRRDAGALTNFVTYSQRLKDKLVNFAKLRAAAKNSWTSIIPNHCLDLYIDATQAWSYLLLS